MRIERREDGSVTVLTIEGVIKLGESATTFSRYLEGLLEEGIRSVVIDLAGIDYVDSTGLGELVGYLQKYTERGRRLGLLNPQSRILNLLRLTQLDETFPIFDSLEQAVEEMGGS
jgi:anti-sigma B factor antagonist